MQWIALQWPPEAWSDALPADAPPGTAADNAPVPPAPSPPASRAARAPGGPALDCPQTRSGPSTGSAGAAAQRGGLEPQPGRPKAASAPSGGSAAGEAAQRGGIDLRLCTYWALQFTPRVCWLGEVLLLEVAASLRLWGGLGALLLRMNMENPAATRLYQAQSAIGLVAVAQLRLQVLGLAAPPPAQCPAALPLHTLDAARPYLPVLERLGCRTWGQAHALPRGGLVRRFGPGLRAALDVAFGLAPESYPWLTLPECFDQALELQARIDNAPALLWAATRLLGSLQQWLRARQLGVLAFELSWTLDLKRLNGQPLPPEQSLPIRTAQPTQAMDHLRRLLAERLAQVRLAAPAVHLRLRATDTAPWQVDSRSLLPEDRRRGDPLHVFVERVSARLGATRVLAAEPVADHRPEGRQHWRPALQVLAGARAAGAPPGGAAAAGAAAAATGSGASRVPTTGRAARPAAHPVGARGVQPAVHVGWADGLAPTSLLCAPQALPTRQGQPWHHGPLRLLTAAQRIEAGWWPDAQGAEGETGRTAAPISPLAPAAWAGAGAGTAARPTVCAADSPVAARAPVAGGGRRAPAQGGAPEPRRTGVAAPSLAGVRTAQEAAAPPHRRVPAGAAPLASGVRGAQAVAGAPRGRASEPGAEGATREAAQCAAAGAAPGRAKAVSGPAGGRVACPAGMRATPEPPPERPPAASDAGAGSTAQAAAPRAGPAPTGISRDYFVAQNPRGELLWVFCERPTAARPGRAGQGARWFLHGVYG